MRSERVGMSALQACRPCLDARCGGALPQTARQAARASGTAKGHQLLGIAERSCWEGPRKGTRL